MAVRAAMGSRRGEVLVTADVRSVWRRGGALDPHHVLFFQIDGGRYDHLPYADDHLAAARLGFADGQADLTGDPGTLAAGDYSASSNGRFDYRSLPAGEHTVLAFAMDQHMRLLGRGYASITVP
jgi:hypothetical protein